ncbi:hypothetical protein LENED_012160 [Lentinula edodes]|uniref:Uncharacterized protein n=1 Tax=Lentinula edodes TaxID=5353 RepID=A0A1Q3ERZ4_LENED|nr:hypothetical protein LENED_012160 [Lentinula edodes]
MLMESLSPSYPSFPFPSQNCIQKALRNNLENTAARVVENPPPNRTVSAGGTYCNEFGLKVWCMQLGCMGHTPVAKCQNGGYLKV